MCFSWLISNFSHEKHGFRACIWPELSTETGVGSKGLGWARVIHMQTFEPKKSWDDIDTGDHVVFHDWFPMFSHWKHGFRTCTWANLSIDTGEGNNGLGWVCVARNKKFDCKKSRVDLIVEEMVLSYDWLPNSVTRWGKLCLCGSSDGWEKCVSYVVDAIGNQMVIGGAVVQSMIVGDHVEWWMWWFLISHTNKRVRLGLRGYFFILRSENV